MGLLHALIASFAWIYVHREVAIRCPNPTLVALDGSMDHCYFSETYFQARYLFRHFAKRAGADEMVQLHIDESHTIDLAVFRGSPKKLLLHISGTHGSEGFVGSAVQSYILRQAVLKSTSIGSRDLSSPTIVFVHALNPFGMSNWRRWNENGVDLNRNAMFYPEEWKDVLEREPNVAGYEDMDYLFNPQEPPSEYGFWRNLPTIVKALMFDTLTIKKAAVAGTYSNNRGIFYGGRALQRSHTLLSDWLTANNFTSQVEDLSLIDVHSGLGPSGKDSLMFHESRFADISNSLSSILHNEKYPPYSIEGVFDGKVDEQSASAGYELTKGFVTSGYPSLFTNARQVVSVTQEFGTRHPLVVLKALVQENQAWNFLPLKDRSPFQEMIYDAFVLKSTEFRENVISRGSVLFDQFYCLMN